VSADTFGQPASHSGLAFKMCTLFSESPGAKLRKLPMELAQLSPLGRLKRRPRASWLLTVVALAEYKPKEGPIEDNVDLVFASAVMSSLGVFVCDG